MSAAVSAITFASDPPGVSHDTISGLAPHAATTPLSDSLGSVWWCRDSALLPQANLVDFLDEGYLGHERYLPQSLEASRCLPTRCAPQVERLGEACCLDAELPRES